MAADELSDLELVRRIASSDKTALKIFYDKYADLLFAYIRHLLSAMPLADIEDIWQETLVSTIQSISNFEGRCRLFTWLCGIAKRKVADYHRRRNSMPNAAPYAAIRHPENLIDTNTLPEAYFLHQATRMKVIEALEILPVEYREILVQRYIDAASVSEIAKSLGKTYKATESLLSRARQKFKTAYILLSKEN